MSSTSAVTASGHQYIDGLLSGSKWASPVITFAMPSLASQYEYSGERGTGFKQLTSTQAAAVVKILKQVSAVTDLSFQAVDAGTQTADMRFARSSMPSTAWAYEPSDVPEGGDVWINSTSNWYANPSLGTYGYFALMHEIGHALGLKHGHETYGFGALPASHNSMEFSIMTDASYIGAKTSGGFRNDASSYAQSLMMDDIAALQVLYGADYTTHSGNTVYRWNPATGEQYINGVSQGRPADNIVFRTIWDGGGTDTYDFSNYKTGVRVNLNPGATSLTAHEQRAHLGDGHLARGNVFNAYLHAADPRSYIENAIGGSGNDVLIGNSVKNAIYGGSGNDNLYGGSGNDILKGGAGADRLFGGVGLDTAIYAGSKSGINLDLSVKGTRGEALGDTFNSIEGVLGTAFNDIISGNAAANFLHGGGGNDLLFGKAGNDTLTGGTGADVLNGGLGFDTVSYASAASGVSLDLNSGRGTRGEAYGDRFSSIEVVTGSAFNDVLFGRIYADKISCGAGDDLIWGRGGADSLIGGAGNDIFRYMSAAEGGDLILDFSTGSDRVLISSAGFAGTTAGALNPELLEFGSAASVSGAVFVFDNTTGALMWDADGVGAGVAIVIATLHGVSTLSASDIFIL